MIFEVEPQGTILPEFFLQLAGDATASALKGLFRHIIAAQRSRAAHWCRRYTLSVSTATVLLHWRWWRERPEREEQKLRVLLKFYVKKQYEAMECLKKCGRQTCLHGIFNSTTIFVVRSTNWYRQVWLLAADQKSEKRPSMMLFLFRSRYLHTSLLVLRDIAEYIPWLERSSSLTLRNKYGRVPHHRKIVT